MQASPVTFAAEYEPVWFASNPSLKVVALTVSPKTSRNDVVKNLKAFIRIMCVVLVIISGKNEKMCVKIRYC